MKGFEDFPRLNSLLDQLATAGDSDMTYYCLKPQITYEDEFIIDRLAEKYARNKK